MSPTEPGERGIVMEFKRLGKGRGNGQAITDGPIANDRNTHLMISLARLRFGFVEKS